MCLVAHDWRSTDRSLRSRADCLIAQNRSLACNIAELEVGPLHRDTHYRHRPDFVSEGSTLEETF